MKLLEIYKQILEELQNEKKLARDLDEKNNKKAPEDSKTNHGHNNK